MEKKIGFKFEIIIYIKIRGKMMLKGDWEWRKCWVIDRMVTL